MSLKPPTLNGEVRGGDNNASHVPVLASLAGPWPRPPFVPADRCRVLPYPGKETLPRLSMTPRMCIQRAASRLRPSNSEIARAKRPGGATWGVGATAVCAAAPLPSKMF